MSYWTRIGVIFGIVCLLLIPLFMVGGLAEERKSYKNGAIKEIAANFGRSQTIVSPYLRIPYEKGYEVVSKEGSADDGTLREIINIKYDPYTYYLPPQQVTVQGEMDVQNKYRRIYSTAAYVANFTISGSFQLTEQQLETLYNTNPTDLTMPNRTSGLAYLEFHVTDSKGLRGDIEIRVNGEKLAFAHDRDEEDFSVIRATLPLATLSAAEPLDFNIQLPLNGTGSVSFLPTGLANDYDIKGNWPHPKFDGNYLPDTRVISDDGFEGQWSTSWLSGTVIEKDGVVMAGQQNMRPDADEYVFGVEFIDPVDIYSLVDRATKYGYLFVVLTFVIIFMLEIMRNVQLHPVQYGLTGVALTVFYLLLLSLSEHISFAASYFVASFACIGLISFYLHFSLKKIASTAAVAISLIFSYMALFMLLNVSDYALLLGSVLIFVVLAAVMIGTRRINWYGIGHKEKKEQE